MLKLNGPSTWVSYADVESATLSKDEVWFAISRLKADKASGVDTVVA